MKFSTFYYNYYNNNYIIYKIIKKGLRFFLYYIIYIYIKLTTVICHLYSYRMYIYLYRGN